MEWFCAVLGWIRDPSNLTAISTFIITLFTVVLAVVGYVQARLIRMSIDLARAEFISTHRPTIRLRRIKPILPIRPNERIEALIEAANIGATIATIFEIGVDIYVANQPFNARPVSVPIVMVEPGKQANINVRGQQLSQSQIANMGSGPGLRMLGIINYRDDNGAIRTTSFARTITCASTDLLKSPTTIPIKIESTKTSSPQRGAFFLSPNWKQPVTPKAPKRRFPLSGDLLLMSSPG